MNPTLPLRADTRRPYAALPFDLSLLWLHDGDGGHDSVAGQRELS